MARIVLKMVSDDAHAGAVGRILHWSEKEKRDRLVVEVDLSVLGSEVSSFPGRRLSVRAKGDMLDVVFGVRSARAWASLSDEVSADQTPTTTFLLQTPTIKAPSVFLGGWDPPPRALRAAGWRTVLQVLFPGPSDRPAPGDWVFGDAEMYVLSRGQGSQTQLRVEFLR